MSIRGPCLETLCGAPQVSGVVGFLSVRLEVHHDGRCRVVGPESHTARARLRPLEQPLFDHQPLRRYSVRSVLAA